MAGAVGSERARFNADLAVPWSKPAACVVHQAPREQPTLFYPTQRPHKPRAHLLLSSPSQIPNGSVAGTYACRQCFPLGAIDRSTTEGMEISTTFCSASTPRSHELTTMWWSSRSSRPGGGWVGVCFGCVCVWRRGVCLVRWRRGD